VGEELAVPEGVQAFNLWTIWIMARLWEEFPRPQYFNTTPSVVSVTSDARVAGTQIGPQGAPQVQLFTYTLNWLLAEGFARGTAHAAGNFTNVSLTAKGFSVLSQAPRSVAPQFAAKPEKSLGALMREAAASHVTDAAAKLIQTLLER
jgi:hypothetical protein